MLRIPRQLPFFGLTVWLAIKLATAAGMIVPLAVLQSIPRSADTPLLGALDVTGACLLLLLVGRALGGPGFLASPILVTGDGKVKARRARRT